MSEPKRTAKKPAEKKAIGDIVEKTASEVRKQPVKSVVWAFFIGIVLSVFPLGRIVGGLAGLVFALLRPALMLLGCVKVWEEMDKRRK